MIRGMVVRSVMFAAVVGFVGCGSGERKTAVVTGKVTYKGKPVPTGTVTFVPKTPGPSATGDIKPDGTYTLTTYRSGDGAVIDDHQVMIIALEDMGMRLPEDRNPTPPPIVPIKYASTATSGLTAKVVEGTNTFDFELKDDKSGKK